MQFRLAEPWMPQWVSSRAVFGSRGDPWGEPSLELDA